MEIKSADVQKVRKILIVGGSLSGLLAGVLLKAIPQLESITILERSEPDRLQDQGAGIRLGTEVIETLRKFTAFPVEMYSEPLELHRVLDDEGSHIFNVELHDFSTSWGRLFLVLRQTFEELSSGGVEGVYRPNCKVTAVEDNECGLKVVFDIGNTVTESLVADLVIGADGASSTLRGLVEAEPQRSYAGYVCLRGMIPLSLLPERTRLTFHRTAVFSFPRNRTQCVLYPVPSSEKDLESETCINWAWYRPKTEMELEDLMTDGDGFRHSYTLPKGSMREEIIDIIKRQAKHGLAPQIAEIVQKTVKPFAQAVTDNIAGRNCFLGGKLLLVGDAVAGQRPHTASALFQAAFHVSLLRDHLSGKLSLEDWCKETLAFSSTIIIAGRKLGKTLMIDNLWGPARMMEYIHEFRATQAKLKAKWAYFVEGISET